MKKILAGILAAVSMLSVSATAFATDKTVTKPGEVEYDVPVTAPTVVLSLVMPAKMQAALNPYGAEIKFDEDGTNKTSALIASTAYKVTNNTEDYGVYIDATAVTTIETADKEKWAVTDKKVVDGTKSATLALIGANGLDTYAAAANALTDANVTNSAASDADTQGVLAMNSTVVADKEKGVVAGQTSQKKVFFIAAGGTDLYMGFAGDLAESKTQGGTTQEVEWTEDDAINVNLVLKVTAGPKELKTTP